MKSIPPLQQQKLPASVDIRALLEEARREVEGLAREGWTDYNTHDPGISILEQLAYAISDLGLRSGLAIEDYLANIEDGYFYTAREVLPNAAFTPLDYRRLLIGLPTVRNAWITVPFWEPSGIYQPLVELEPLVDNGEQIDLNAKWIKLEPVQINKRRLDPYLSFGYEKELEILWKRRAPISEVHFEIENITTEPVGTRVKVIDEFFIDAVRFKLTDGKKVMLRLKVNLREGIHTSDSQALSQFKQALHRLLTAPEAIALYFQPQVDQLYRQLQQLGPIRDFIKKHRNLCEDWMEPGIVDYQEIGIQIDPLELHPEADPVEELARVYFVIEQFIDPSIQPSTFQGLRALDQKAADIFTGPLLEEGFFPESAFHKVERGGQLFASDLIRLIMQQPSVIGVKEVTFNHYSNQRTHTKRRKNCLSLADLVRYQPKFSFDNSSASVIKNGALINVDPEKVKEKWGQLKEEYLASFEYDSSGDVPVPRGDQLDLTTFYSIQNEFPQAYGLRDGEIPNSALPLRQAQARQLKAYLLFFEQLMLNFCGQLGNLQELFSMRSDVEHTYFGQPLYDVPAVKELLNAFLAEQAQNGPLNWENFRQNCNAYIKALEEATENRSTFLQRRNQFVDHLLARLGEDFSDYSAWTIAQNGGQISPVLLFDKLDFLRNAPGLSSPRALTFDYTAEKMWDTDNVSGYEKRVAALLGIPDCRRRSLARVFDPEEFIERYDTSVGGLKNFRIRSPEGKIILTNTRTYSDASEREQVIEKVKTFSRYGRYYKAIRTEFTRKEECKFYFILLDDNLDELAPIARRIEYFPNRAKVEQEIQKAIHVMQGRTFEGMHVIEHILLRPIDESSKELDPVSFQVGDYQLKFISDPYSFQVSIFLPGWLPRFQDPEFRALAERTLRKELPAHLFAWIYWVEPYEPGGPIPEEFFVFEEAYRLWLENINSPERVRFQNEFIDRFNEIVASGYVTRTNTYIPFDIPKTD